MNPLGRIVKIKTIVFLDDHEIHIDDDTSIQYTMNTQFVEVHYKGQLNELINICAIKSMDTIPAPTPPRKCKWCQQSPCTCGKS